MAMPDIIPDLEDGAADAAGTLSVDGAALRWAFDGPTLFLSDIAGDSAALERLFARADVFARGRFAEALVVRFRSGDAQQDVCRRLGFEDAAGAAIDGFVSLVRDVP